MLALLAEEKKRRLEAAIKNREYLVNKAKEQLNDATEEAPVSKKSRKEDEGTAASAMQKLVSGGGGITSADIVAIYGGSGKRKKKKKKGNSGVYIQGLPQHLTEVELRIALERVCERTVAPVRRIKIYQVADQPGIVKGDALVIFEAPKDAVKAVEVLHGEQLQAGFPMTVSRAEFDSGTRSANDSAFAEESSDAGPGPGPGPGMAAPMAPNPFGGKRGDGYAPQQPSSANAPLNFAPPQALLAQAAAAAQQQQAPIPSAPIMAQPVSCTVLLYNVFDPTRELNPYLNHKSDLKGIEKEMYQECARFGRIINFDILEGGSVMIVFAQRDAAARCVDVMHGRYFDGRQMVADYLPDGTTSKHIPRLSKAVVLGNVFDPIKAMDLTFVQELCKDFEIQCSQYGPIEKLDVSWTETTSTITIIYVSSISAADCIAGMNNLTCDGRQLSAAYDPSYLVTEKEVEIAREQSVTEKQRMQRAEEEKRQREALEAAKKKGAEALEKEKAFQAFWKTVNEEDDDKSVFGNENQPFITP